MQNIVKYKTIAGRRIAACLLLLLSWTGMLSAQEPQLSVQAPRSVPAGQAFEVVYTINVRGAKSFQAPSFEGLDILYGPYQSQSSSFQFVNGRQSQSFNLSFTYGLQATQEGSITVEAASIVVDGKTYQSEPFTLTVTQGSSNSAHQAGRTNSSGMQARSQAQSRQTNTQNQQNLPPEVSDQDLFVTVQPSKKNPYVG